MIHGELTYLDEFFFFNLFCEFNYSFAFALSVSGSFFLPLPFVFNHLPCLPVGIFNVFVQCGSVEFVELFFEFVF